MTEAQWKNAPDFHEIAEALKCQTVDIMAALATPDGSFMAMFTPEPDADDPMIYSAMIRRDADDILVAGPRREVETTSSFMEKMHLEVGAKLEEEFGPPERGFTPGYHGTIPPYDVEPDDEDPEERDE